MTYSCPKEDRSKSIVCLDFGFNLKQVPFKNIQKSPSKIFKKKKTLKQCQLKKNGNYSWLSSILDIHIHIISQKSKD